MKEITTEEKIEIYFPPSDMPYGSGSHSARYIGLCIKGLALIIADCFDRYIKTIKDIKS